MPDLKQLPLRSVVGVAPVLTSAVQLRGSLWTEDREAHAAHLDRFIPTQFGREALLGVLRGTRAAAPQRVHFLTGSYGTGKSYLLLVLASLLGLRLDDPRLASLIGRIRKGEETYGDGLTREIDTARQVETDEQPGYGYLIVVPDYADREYDRAILNALRDALRGAGLDYRFPTEFTEAVRVLDQWESWHSAFVEQLEALLAPEGGSVARLRSQLQEHDGEALARFGALSEQITGVPYSAPHVPLEETFRQTSSFLKTQGYRGIAVLFDEFGFFLEEAASGRAGTAVAAVQTFMEFARSRPSADILLVLAAHRALADYGSGEAGRAEMKKMEGRLEKTYRLRASAEHREAEEMMAGAFVVPPDADEAGREAALNCLRARADAEDWAGRAATWYGGAGDTEWVQRTVVEGTYPLHPTATLALPGLSDDVGQNTRTMFRFLAPGEPGGADAFIRTSTVETERGALALLTLDALYDYFVAPAEGDASAAGPASAARAEYRAARAVLRTDDYLAERVLKTVAVIGLLRDPRLQASASTLRWALHLPAEEADSLDDLLRVLVAQGALRQNQNTKLYSFRSAGGTSTDALFAEKRRAVGTLDPDALLALLRETSPPSPHDPFTYNDRLSTNRRVAIDYVTPGTENAVLAAWRERFGRLYNKGDAKGYEGNLVVLYGLYEDEDQRERLVEALAEASRATTFVAAVSATPTPLSDLAANVAAARALLDDPKVQADENAVNEAALLVQQHTEALAAALSRALDPGRFAWYVRGERRHEPDALRSPSLRRFLDKAVEEAFPDTPIISYDLVQQYPDRGNRKRDGEREQAVDRMLQPVGFSMQGTDPVAATLQGLLKSNQMFEGQDVRGNERIVSVVAPPQDASAAPAWAALTEELIAADTPRRNRKVSDVLPRLYRPPLGMSAPAAEVLLGAFVAVHREGFELRDASGKQMALSGPALLGACRKKGYVLVHQAISPSERAVLDAVGAALDRRGLPAVERSLGPWADPAARLAEWHSALPDLTKKRAPAEDADVGALIDALNEYRGRRDDEQARTLLTVTLPDAFDADVLDNPSARDAFARRLGAAIKSATRFADDYAEEVLKESAHRAFGEVVGGSAEFVTAVETWRNALPPAAKQHAYESPADALLRLVNRASGDDAHQRFLSELPREWGMVSFRAWRSKKQRKDYLNTFRDAVREVNAFRASPLPLLRRLHGEAFGDGVAVPASEADVDAAFKEWLHSLPDATFHRLSEGAFGPVASALMAAIEGAGTVEERYLEVLADPIPQVVGPWDTWAKATPNVFVHTVGEAVREVTAWTPPLSADDTAAAVLDALDWPAGTDTPAPAALDAAAEAWYDGLSPATRRHEFDGLADAVLSRLRAHQGLSAGLSDSLPTAAGLPPLHEAGDAAAHSLAHAIAQAVQRVEAWRRPPLDVLRLASSDDLPDASAFTLRLGEWVRSLHPTPTPEGLSQAAVALLTWSAAGTAWQSAFATFAKASGLSPDVHAWTSADDATFAEAVEAARSELAAWTPPPVDPDALREAVSDALRRVLRSTGATPAELQGVLFQAVATLER